MKKTILKYTPLLALLGTSFFSTQTLAAECQTGASPSDGCTIDVSDITYTLTGDIDTDTTDNIIDFGAGANSNTLNFIGNITSEGLDARAFSFSDNDGNTLTMTGNIITEGNGAEGIKLFPGVTNANINMTGNITTSGTAAYGIGMIESDSNTTTLTGDITTTGGFNVVTSYSAYGIGLENIEIAAPFWEPPEEEDEVVIEEPEEEIEPSHEPEADTGEEHEESPIASCTQRDATFTGLEAEVNFTLASNDTYNAEMGFFGDMVSAELNTGGNLPRIPTSKIGTELRFFGNNWSTHLHVTRFNRQSDAGRLELETDGYTLVSVYADYHLSVGTDSEVKMFLRGNNLLNEQIRNHASFLKNYSPEFGRGVTLGLRFEY